MTVYDGGDEFRRLALDKEADEAARLEALTGLAALRRPMDADVLVTVAWDDFSSLSLRRVASAALEVLRRPEAGLLWALNLASHDDIQDADREDFTWSAVQECSLLLDPKSISRLVALLIDDVLIRDAPG